jgi:hypothetical protein
MADEEDVLIEKDSKENFSSWLNRPFVGEELRKELAKANVLMVPMEGVRERKDLNFPSGTEGLLEFLKENARDGMVPDICIDDKDFKTLVLHDVTIILGSFVVTALLAPVVADLISEYLKKEIWPDKPEETKVDFKMTIVESDGTSKELSYNGPAKTFEKTIGTRLKAPKTAQSTQRLPSKEER